jgi:spermidine synthase
MAATRLNEALTDSSGVYFDAGTLVAARQSAFQKIEVFDCPDLGRLMRIDGSNMTSERDEYFYHEALIHPAVIAHPDPQRVLIIGGGDGGAAEELLKHPVAICRLCELDPAVVDMSRTYLGRIHGGVFGDPRLMLDIGDGMAFVRATEDSFDLIYLDLPDPVGAAEPLYAPRFYRDCRRVLNKSGALVMHIGSPFSHPARVEQSLQELRTQFAIVTPYFVHIPIYGAVWGFAVASDVLDIRQISAVAIDAALAARHIEQRQLYNGAIHHAMLALPEYVKTLVA